MNKRLYSSFGLVTAYYSGAPMAESEMVYLQPES